jgi:hypothetical protein
MKGKAKITMYWTRHVPQFAFFLSLIACSSLPSSAQNCQIGSDMDEAVKNAITSTAQRLFAMAAKGDTASLRQNSVSDLAANFSGVESAVKARQPELAGAQATVKGAFELEKESSSTGNSEFFCGVFGKNGQTQDSAIFNLNVPAGKYAIVILDAASPKGRTSFTPVLELQGSDWKLGGLYLKASEVAGHDSNWFISQARAYKSKGQTHNAWFYYLEGRSLLSPVPFMSTQATDRLYDEFQSSRPTDLPADGKPADLSAGPATYKVTELFPDVVGSDLDLIVKYQTPDASNSNQAYQSNIAVIKALVTKYPELRDAFAAVVARAVDPSNRDYGTLLAMKDIK